MILLHAFTESRPIYLGHDQLANYEQIRQGLLCKKNKKRKPPQNKAVVKMAFDLLLFATRGLRT
jgi:hypothetical protein